MELKGKKALVVGMGRTGVPAANRLAALGASVLVTDKTPREKLGADIAKLSPGVEVEAGSRTVAPGRRFDLAVASPGVPWDGPLLSALRSAGTEVISEIELAWRLAPRDWVAITGTNGKSTTTALTGAILKEAGIPAVVCGNIGNAVIGEDAVFAGGVTVVAEISSFQLEGAVMFRPRISAILNITPDHLDRHRTMEEYAALKERVFRNQEGDDVCVLNFDDAGTMKLRGAVRCRLSGFSTRQRMGNGAFAEGGTIYVASGGKAVPLCGTKELKIVGGANVENALAASAIAFAAGAEPSAIARALVDFRALPHRTEPVAEHGGVRFVNDSKGTNVGSTLKALEGMEGHVAVILGGQGKGQDFSPLAELVKRKGAFAVLIGEDAGKIAGAFGPYPAMARAATLAEAVAVAAERAGPGGVVLLSPACASFDMFKNYEDRGEKFRAAVAEFIGGIHAYKA